MLTMFWGMFVLYKLFQLFVCFMHSAVYMLIFTTKFKIRIYKPYAEFATCNL